MNRFEYARTFENIVNAVIARHDAADPIAADAANTVINANVEKYADGIVNNYMGDTFCPRAFAELVDEIATEAAWKYTADVHEYRDLYRATLRAVRDICNYMLDDNLPEAHEDEYRAYVDGFGADDGEPDTDDTETDTDDTDDTDE